MNELGQRGTFGPALMAALVLVVLCAPWSAQAAKNSGEDSVIVNQNLFRDDRKPPPPPEFKVVVKRPVRGLNKVEYEGVVALGKMKKALVKAPNVFLDPDSKQKGYDQVWVKEGESLGDFTVVSIDSQKLVIKKGEKSHTVKLRPEGGKKGSTSHLLLTDLAGRTRKTGSRLLLYGRDGMLIGDASLADLGAHDLDPGAPIPFDGRTDLITEEMLAENERETDTGSSSGTSSDDDLERASNTVSLDSGWTTVASLDDTSALEAVASAAKEKEAETTDSGTGFTPGTTSVDIEITEEKTDIEDILPNTNNKEKEERECALSFKDCSCLDVMCIPMFVSESEWDEYCCGPWKDWNKPEKKPGDDDEDDEETNEDDPGGAPGFVP